MTILFSIYLSAIIGRNFTLFSNRIKIKSSEHLTRDYAICKIPFASLSYEERECPSPLWEKVKNSDYCRRYNLDEGLNKKAPAEARAFNRQIN